MKTFITVLIFSGLFTIAQAAVNDVHLDDGNSHVISTTTYKGDYVRLDELVANDPGTHLDIYGGVVSSLAAYNISTVTMTGGTINDLFSRGQSSFNMLGGSVSNIGIWDNATAIINGGTTNSFGLFGEAVADLNGGNTGLIYTKENSILNITGGRHEGYLNALHNSQITISGGNFLSNINVTGNAKIYLEGNGFQINGVPVKYGDKARDYSIISYNNFIGTITGTLADGTAFSCPYQINKGYSYYPDYTADIVIIPEPCSVLLLGIGGLMLRKKKSQ